MPRADGVDVSYWQGRIDWNAVARAGMFWGATRVWDRQHGPGVDVTYGPNRQGMAAAGLRYRLLYWYLEPNRSPTQQADQCFQIVGSLLPGEAIMLDAESTTTEAQAVEFIQRTKQHYGNRVSCYTALFVDGARTWRSARVFDGTVPRVFASYRPENEARSAAAPFSWAAWQWTAAGQIPGISGGVDCDQIDDRAAFEAICYPSSSLCIFGYPCPWHTG